MFRASRAGDKGGGGWPVPEWPEWLAKRQSRDTAGSHFSAVPPHALSLFRFRRSLASCLSCVPAHQRTSVPAPDQHLPLVFAGRERKKNNKKKQWVWDLLMQHQLNEFGNRERLLMNIDSRRGPPQPVKLASKITACTAPGLSAWPNESAQAFGQAGWQGPNVHTDVPEVFNVPTCLH
jgi:hypothetical protein